LTNRPVWPANMQPWVDRATQAGIDALALRLKQVINVR
jgi:hypothetical protein